MILGVILAGGASTRMGKDKALVEVNGVPMIHYVAAALASACDRIAVAGHPDPPGPWEVIADRGERFRGPLAGLAAASEAHPHEALMVVGVDQPWLAAATVRQVCARLGERPAVPVEDGFRQALCAAYPPGLASLASAELQGGGSLQSMLDVTAYDAIADWRGWGEDGRSWFSADSPERLAEGIERFGVPSPE